MMISRKSPLSLICLSLIFLFAPVSIHSRQASESTYESLLERVKKSDPTVDFAALRMAYDDHPSKDSGNTDSNTRQTMSSALRDKKYDRAIEYAEQILKGNYVDINAHIVSAIAYKAKKD